MTKIRISVVIALAILFSTSCSQSESSHENGIEDSTNLSFELQEVYEVPVQELDDDAYPDNPDIGFRSEQYGDYSHSKLLMSPNEDGTFQFKFLPTNDISDTVVFPSVDVMSYMLDLPEWVKESDYMTFIGLVNLEWNRQQVRYDDGLDYWEVKGQNKESGKPVRIDIARNCLNSGLWEVAMFEETEDGGNTIYYHGWFTFPLDLYARLFEKKTGLDWSTYEEHLVEWKEPERKEIDWGVLKTETKVLSSEVISLNDQLYPITGARVKKKKNIIVPSSHLVINDFLNDETKYSTFTPPGFYNTADPRPTELSLLNQLNGGEVSAIEHPVLEDTTLYEVRLDFSNQEGDKKHSIYFGGIDLNEIPVLTLEDHNKGLKLPMGLSNHAFYESYAYCLANQTVKNPYYGLIVDSENRWFDSHSLGIDGPIMFWEEGNENILHVMILSFERHSFVGHFTFNVNRGEL